MRIPRAWWIAFLLGGLIGAGISVRLAMRPMRSTAPADAAPLSESRRSAIVTAAQRVSPAVVSVSVEGTQVVNTNPFGSMFHDEYFDRFFLQEQQVRSLGSGVIVDGSGLVVSNEHVVRNADSVKVTLADGRHFAATVLAATPVYDLSVLRIPANHLPVAPLGNSSELVVGEWAIAVGNPFGYLINDPQPTVTAGVISATHRDIQSGATGGGVYKDMIQTDASINPGNSGGALANADGEVVGINTFIFTQTGGSIGLGFAIPINLVKRVIGEVQKYGRIRVPWPGFTVQPVTPWIAQRLGYTDLGGLVVTRVEGSGPAARAGIRVGDRIRKVNGLATDSIDDAWRSIYGASVGDPLAITLERDGSTIKVSLTLAEAPRSGP